MAVFTPPNLLRQPNFAVLVVLAWLLVALGLLLQYWAQTADTLLDTDDAMRLVQMRAWVAGQGWFDLHNARAQPPEGYEPHWSRLVDAGLGGLLAIFKFYAGPETAERLMRAWWPLLWLLPTMIGMSAIAWRIAGRQAAIIALLLALVGVPAYQQFTPGRIDHHNVQIALSVLLVAATVWSDRVRWCAAAAGLLSGLALAVGFESLPYLVVGGGAFALRYLADANAGRALRDYSFAVASGAGFAFAVNVAPEHWLRAQCDAIAINSLVAAAGGGLLLALAASLPQARPIARGLGVVVAAVVPVAAALAIEPRCIGGPFAMVNPEIWPVWHSHVRELQPLLSVFQVNPLTAAGIVAFPAASLAAAFALATGYGVRRDFGFLVALAALLVSVVTTVAAIRGYSYAMWFGLPMAAAAALRLFSVLRLQSLPARVAIGLLFTPMAVSISAITIAHASGLNDTDSFARPASRDCFQTASYAPLTRLPAGLVVTDVSYGPFLLALTPHSVMAAPYHRLGSGIVLASRTLTSTPDEARRLLAKAKATYVMVCGPRPPDGLSEPARSQSLWGILQAGAVPGWLELMPGTAPFAVYRVRS
jgi:hypothetical protein